MLCRGYIRMVALALGLVAAGAGVTAARPSGAHATTSYRTVNLRADSVTQTSITIRWDAYIGAVVPSHRLRHTANQAGIWVWRWLSQVEAENRVLSFNNLSPGTTYSFIIEDCIIACPYSLRLDVTTLMPDPPPLAPTNLRVCGSGPQPEICQGGGTLLRWTDNATTEVWYEFQWAQGQPGVLPRAPAYATVTLPANQGSYRFTPPSAGYYYLRVRACNASGCSAFSNLVSQNLLPQPSLP